MTRIYKGIIFQGDMRAYIFHADGGREELNPRFDLEKKSPTGISWGYNGSGPSQLSLALLSHVIGSKRALPIYHYFKERHIAPLSMKEGWEMTADFIREKAEEIEADIQGRADG